MGGCASKSPPPTNPTVENGSSSKRQEQRQAISNKPSTPANSNSRNNSTGNNNQNESSESSNDDSTGYNEKANDSPLATTSDKEVKVLLLGSGESGKSTIVKQMKILHQNGYSKEELLEYKPFVYKNVMDCIKSVINAIIDLQPTLIKKSDDDSNSTQTDSNSNEMSITPKNKVLDYNDLNEILDYEININSDDDFNVSIAQKISKIYNIAEVQEFIKYQQGHFYLIDSTHYFLSDILRIAKPNYIPNLNDVLRTRKKTSGIYDFRFQMGSGLNIHMFDVGGQRSERKKWIHCFDNVTLIIFCIALSEYDQVLLEENSQNRLDESLTLFDSVVNSRWFARTSIVLFLNKIDVFAEKLPYSPLEDYFPDYNGGNNINKAAKYILWKFTQVNRSGLNIFPHVTQATDTSNIELVFAAVKETILENSLKDSGLL